MTNATKSIKDVSFCSVMCRTNIGSIDNLIPRGIILGKDVLKHKHLYF